MNRMLFSKKTSPSIPTVPVEYPTGSFIETEKGYFYIFSNLKKQRLRILSKRVLSSWHPHRVITTSEAAVAEYRIFSKLGFRNGSLISNISDGKIYLIEGKKKRLIVSPDSLTLIGASSKEVVCVSLDEIKLHEDGIPL